MATKVTKDDRRVTVDDPSTQMHLFSNNDGRLRKCSIRVSSLHSLTSVQSLRTENEVANAVRSDDGDSRRWTGVLADEGAVRHRIMVVEYGAGEKTALSK